MKTPKAIKQLVDILSALPGIGPRQAIRLAFYFIRQGKGFQKELEESIRSLQGVGICARCFYIHEGRGLCEICADEKRDHSTVAVVEKETDLMSIENTGKFNGRYFILGELGRGGVLEADQKLRLKSLKSWIDKELGGKAKEIIVALNPDTQGDFVAAQIIKELKDSTENISRLGVGIPSGGEIEFADEETLGSALDRRR
ncbi:MAG: toprim domain-containing protein [bacterium]|nr:toprim domain-containing protein [bacterium]MDZ4231523.1 toprim domain-containing protein [Patescibacteria group bacterium]